jgi:hypothetical protein
MRSGLCVLSGKLFLTSVHLGLLVSYEGTFSQRLAEYKASRWPGRLC